MGEAKRREKQAIVKRMEPMVVDTPGGRIHVHWHEGHAAALEVRKLYEFQPDPMAWAMHCIRIVDEEGEDCVYPEKLFMPMGVSASVSLALHKRAA